MNLKNLLVKVSAVNVETFILEDRICDQAQWKNLPQYLMHSIIICFFLLWDTLYVIQNACLPEKDNFKTAEFLSWLIASFSFKVFKEIRGMHFTSVFPLLSGKAKQLQTGYDVSFLQNCHIVVDTEICSSNRWFTQE